MVNDQNAKKDPRDNPTGYCVKCRAKNRKMVDVQEVEMKGKGGPRRALKGKCEVCGTGMYRILGKKA